MVLHLVSVHGMSRDNFCCAIHIKCIYILQEYDSRSNPTREAKHAHIALGIFNRISQVMQLHGMSVKRTAVLRSSILWYMPMCIFLSSDPYFVI
jgi:hypothetical protein